MNNDARSESSTTESTTTMQPHEKQILEALGLKQPSKAEKIGRAIGTLIGFLIVTSVYGYAFVFTFNFTLPQGLVLGWMFSLLLDAIRNGGKK
jgi:hypothetical protein